MFGFFLDILIRYDGWHKLNEELVWLVVVIHCAPRISSDGYDYPS